MKYIQSFGGGLNSSALLVYLVKNNKPLDAVLFADTGDEWPHTYTAVTYYQNWLRKERPDIIFEIVRSKYNKTLYQYCWDKKIIPSRMTRDCTDKFKLQPMRRFMRAQWDMKQEHFIRYIGIDYSEAHRIKDSMRKNETNAYPLIDAEMNRNDCKKLLLSYNLLVPEKSGCWYCPFTSRKNFKVMAMNKPEYFEKAVALEQNHRHYPRPVSLLRDSPLIQIKNSRKDQTQILDFFDNDDHNCDVVGSCFL